MWGDVYRTDLDLVISDDLGAYLKPGSVSAKVSLLMRKLGMPKCFTSHLAPFPWFSLAFRRCQSTYC
jgi:hypothetical protein